MKYIVRLEGGIGNQMFQYAHVRALQNLYPGDIIYDTHTYTKNQIRHLSLDHLNVTRCADTNSLSIVERIKLRIVQAIHKILKKINIRYPNKFDQMTYGLMIKIGIYMQFRYKEFDSLVKPCRSLNYISGTYLAPYFFKGVDKELKFELSVRDDLTPKSKKVLRQIQSTNSVCIHIRLGDYLNPEWKDRLYICTEEYYKKAIDLMRTKVENPTFYVFSNNHKDIEWIKLNYQLPDDLVYVDLCNPDYEDLKLMYNCKHFIISNSTYSWWGQWLSASKDKVVIAPSRFNNVLTWDMSGIYSEDWLIIPV